MAEIYDLFSDSEIINNLELMSVGGEVDDEVYVLLYLPVEDGVLMEHTSNKNKSGKLQHNLSGVILDYINDIKDIPRIEEFINKQLLNKVKIKINVKICYCALDLSKNNRIFTFICKSIINDRTYKILNTKYQIIPSNALRHYVHWNFGIIIPDNYKKKYYNTIKIDNRIFAKIQDKFAELIWYLFPFPDKFDMENNEFII